MTGWVHKEQPLGLLQWVFCKPGALPVTQLCCERVVISQLMNGISVHVRPIRANKFLYTKVSTYE